MIEPLRIVLPIHSFEPGGVERVALNLAVRWQESGHDIVVVLGRDEGLDRQNAPRGLNYFTTRCPIPSGPFETLWMMWCMMRYLLQSRADVIFCPGNTYTVVCVVMKLLFGDRCPPVVVKVSNDLVRKDKSNFRRVCYRLWLKVNGLMLERFVALAEPMAEEIALGMGVGAHRIVTIHDPALDRRRFERLLAIPRDRKPELPRHFVAVGRLAPQKNLTMLLLAFASGFRPGDRLTIVGGGSERAALERTVRYLALQGTVTFAGYVPCPDAYLQAADCLLLSSHYEGVPAVVIEAIAAGLPVIATDCSCSMATLLGDGSRGILVPVGDRDAMAAAIADPEALPAPEPFQRSYAGRYTLEQASAAYLAVLRAAVRQAERIQREVLPELSR